MKNNDPLLKRFLKQKWVLAIISLDLIILVAVIALVVEDALKTSMISFNVAPIDAKVLVDGKEGYGNGMYRFKPGDYEIQILREGLDDKTIEISLTSNSVINVAVFLLDEGKFDFYTLKGNYDSFYKLAEIASAGNNLTIDNDASAEEFIEQYEKEYAIYATALPIDYSEYDTDEDGKRELVKDITIQANNDKECSLTLCLKALMVGTDDKKLVESLLVEKGFNMEDYEIFYKIY